MRFARARDVDQALALGDRHRHRLLDQHVRAGIEKSLGDFKVRGGRRDDADRIDVAQQITVIGVRRDARSSAATAARAVADGSAMPTSCEFGRLAYFCAWNRPR